MHVRLCLVLTRVGTVLVNYEPDDVGDEGDGGDAGAGSGGNRGGCGNHPVLEVQGLARLLACIRQLRHEGAGGAAGDTSSSGCTVGGG